MKYLELWELDFTGVDEKLNAKVHSQGILKCIKTCRAGFFSLELERFPSRQDLANKKFLKVLFL